MSTQHQKLGIATQVAKDVLTHAHTLFPVESFHRFMIAYVDPRVLTPLLERPVCSSVVRLANVVVVRCSCVSGAGPVRDAQLVGRA